MARKVELKAQLMAMSSPLDDFHDLNIVPEYEDVCVDCDPVVRPNIIENSYPDAQTYLDIHFRLLREDFFYPLRCGILAYRRSAPNVLKNEDENVRIYTTVKIKSALDSICQLQFSTAGMGDINWKESKQLAYGSLLCLSADDFRSAIFFTVIDSNPENLSKGMLKARCEDEDSVPDSYFSKSFVMLESVAFFEAYRHVLQELKRLPLDEFPLRRYVLGQVNSASEPRYLASVSKPVYDLSCITSSTKYVSVPIRHTGPFPSPAELGLNDSQSAALFSALTSQVALIQGPPGTGKTHVVKKIVQVLLSNRQLWARSSSCPILVISYTNGGLDQLLEKMLSFTDDIVRVGGRSKSELLQPHLLSTLREKLKASRPRLTDENICRRADIVGMTTTGAAKKKSLIEALKPRILIVEEAAMTLEAHVVAALTSSSQHLIMIGDHKQLKPSTSAHHLSDDPYHLNVSLFERLINRGLEPSVLNVQHRMRPEVSRLIVPYIYSDLRDAESVRRYPPIRGMEHSVFFLMHEHREKVHVDGRSRLNCYEVTMALGLARYLMLQGYRPSQITILTTYFGQRVHFEAASNLDIHITTVDNYQGEENDIIILSLVRSNEQQNIGFLKIENRICVGLSRAKQGFYLIGDMNALQKRSPFWSSVSRVLQSNGQLGPAFPLICQLHGNITKVKNQNNFPGNGGCGRVCNSPMPCGHVCQKTCHSDDVDHLNVDCYRRCLRSCDKGHPCKILCFEPCAPCTEPTAKEFNCGHKSIIECHKSANAVCQELCSRICFMGHQCTGRCRDKCAPCKVLVENHLPCGHSRSIECHLAPSKEPCSILMRKQLPCKHLKEMECRANPENVICYEKCSRTCQWEHLCQAVCCKQCPPCNVQVSKQLHCGHKKLMQCGRDLSKEICTQPCPQSCANGHPCPQICNHQCYPCSVRMTKQLACGHSKEMDCCEDPASQSCTAIVQKELPCFNCDGMQQIGGRSQMHADLRISSELRPQLRCAVPSGSFA